MAEAAAASAPPRADEPRAPVTVEEARRAIEADAQRNVVECWNELDAVLQKHRLRYVVQSSFTQGGLLVSQVGLAPAGL